VQHDADWAQWAQRELRGVLNEWDPIGVFDPDDEGDDSGPVDEYDCIRDPLISHLLRGDSRSEVTEFLRDELRSHFGLEPRLVTTDIVDRIFEWWESAQ
jgi:hypothetical protein